MNNLYFSDWETVAGVALMTMLSYLGTVALLRFSGKRTLSKMNAFDLVVTVAMGSMLATVSLSKDISVMDGITGISVLIILQYILTFISVRSKFFKKLITSQPRFLLYKGELLEDNLKAERISIEELHAAARKDSISSFDEIEYIVLETTGFVNIIKKIDVGSPVKAPMLEGIAE